MGIQDFLLSLSIIIIFMFILYNIAKNNNTEQSSKNASEKAEESKSNNLNNLTHAEKAEMYVKNKNYQKAYDEYSLAKNKDKKNANFYDERMDYCLKMWDIADYGRLIERNPYEMIYYRKRRNLYMQVEDYQNALNDSNSIINYNGGTTYDLRTRAEIYIKLKQYISAIEDYEKLITSGSNKSFYNDQIILCRYLMHIEEYDKAIELNPNNADYYEKRADFYNQCSKYTKALSDYTKAIELKPDNSSYYENRAKFFVQNKEYLKAIEDYNKLIELNPEKISSYQDEITNCENKCSIPEYNVLIEKDPNNVSYYEKRAMLFVQNEEYLKAIEDYSKLIKLNPENIEYYEKRAKAYIQCEKPNQAITDYSKLIEFNTSNTFYYNNRAELYLNLKDYNNAIKDYNKIIELKPNNESCYAKRADLYFKQAKYAKAIEEYDKAIKIKPDNDSFYAQRANVYLKLGNNDKAIEDYSKAIKLKSTNYSYYGERADIYFQQKNYDEALKDYNKAIKYVASTSYEKSRYEKRKESIYNIYIKNAQKFVSKNNYEDAIKEFSKAIKIKPLSAKLYFERANCYTHIDKDKAKLDFNEAIFLESENYDKFEQKVTFYHNLKDYDELLKLYRQHLEKNPKDYDALCKRASIWIELDKIEEAKIDLRKAKKYVKETEKEAQIQRTIDSLKNVKSKTKQTKTSTETKSEQKSTSTNKKQVTVTVQHPDVKENNVKADEYIENANKYEIKKDYINAINEYTKAIELNPDNIAEIYVYRAQCCMEFGQYSNVIEDCTNAIKKTKMYNSTAYYTRGLAYEKLNLLDKAKDDYKQALSIKPDNKTYQDAYNKLLQTNSIIDLANCTKEEIQSLNGFNEEKGKRFIEERNNGKMWYDIDSFIQDFEIQPHEMISIQDRIKFPDKPKSRYGRKIDV